MPKISALNAGTTAAGTEAIPAVQAGVTVRLTPRQITQSFSGSALVVVTDYATIAAAYAALPSTGGAVLIPNGYTETLAADLTLDKAYCGLLFQGTATITTGTKRIIMGTTANGVFMRGLGAYQSDISGVGVVGANIVSSVTTGAAVSMGAAGQRTNYHSLANVVIDLRAASAGTYALQLVRTVYWTLDHVSLAGGNAANTALQIDGTAADFGGFGEIIKPIFRNFKFGIVTTGAANAIQMYGGIVDGNGIASSVGLTRDGTLTTSGGFVISDTEISTFTTGVSLTGTITGDNYLLYTENNTTDISAGASTSYNASEFILAFTKSDSGSNNNFKRNGAIKQGAALSVLGNATNAVTEVADIAAASDGNVLRRNGTSIGFGAILLSTGNAVSGQLLPANGGTGSNLSATGGTSQVLKQTSVGGNVTVAQLAASDLSSGAFSIPVTVTSASASALTVGLNGATNPALQVDASTGSQVAGLKVTGAATGGTVAAAVIDSGSNANLTINAKGSGTIGIGSVSTGAVTITPNVTHSGTSTFAGDTTVQKNQNATTTLSLLNTDTTNSSSRATFTFQAGNVSGRMLGIHGDAYYIGSTSASAFNLQYNATNQIAMDGTTVAAQVNLTAPAVTPASYTVATLPAGATGKTVFCSNCRMFNGAGVQEGAAAGTGGLVTYNGTAYKIEGTNVTAVA